MLAGLNQQSRGLRAAVQPACSVLQDMEAKAPDVRVINLETSVTTAAEPWPHKGINYKMHPGERGRGPMQVQAVLLKAPRLSGVAVPASSAVRIKAPPGEARVWANLVTASRYEAGSLLRG